MDLSRFIAIRKEKALKQETLAKMLNCSRSTVAMWERGNNEPNHQMLVNICNVLDCSADYLLGLDNHKHPELTPDELNLLSLYRNADERARIDAARMLADHQTEKNAAHA